MWNERQRLIRNNQENAETWIKNQLKKDSEKKNGKLLDEWHVPLN